MEARVLLLEEMVIQAAAERKRLLTEILELRAAVSEVKAHINCPPTSLTSKRTVRKTMAGLHFKGTERKTTTERKTAVEIQLADMTTAKAVQESPEHMLERTFYSAVTKKSTVPDQTFQQTFHTTVAFDDKVDKQENIETCQHEVALRPLRPTLWEAAVLMFAADLGCCGVVTIIGGLLANIVLQGAFSWIMRHMADIDLPDPRSMQIWRYSDAHDSTYQDAVNGTSLASRVCSFDDSLSFATKQVEILTKIHKYIDGDIGLMLVSCVLVVWCLTVLQELYSMSEFVSLLLALPWGRRSALSMPDNSNWTLEQISYLRLFCMITLTLLRAGFACWLLLVGALWLANTKSLPDLVVNAVALSFILHIDELIFVTLVDSSTKVLVDTGAFVQTLAQKPLGLRCIQWILKGPGVRPILTVVACACFVSSSVYLHVLADITQMHQVRSELCGGKLDFVVERKRATNELLYVNTSTNGAKNKLIKNAVRELMQNHTSHRARGVRSLDHFHVEASEDMKSISDKLSFACFDSMDQKEYGENTRRLKQNIEDEDAIARLWSVRQQSGIWQGKHCEDFLTACGRPSMHLLRLLCPVTCGCHDPGSGLLFSTPDYGCPQNSCRMKDHMPKSGRVCEDVGLTTLNTWKSWHRLLTELNSSGTSVMVSHAELDRVVSSLASKGCSSHSVEYCRSPLRALSFFCPMSCTCNEVRGFSPEHCPLQCENYIEPWQKTALLMKRRPCEDFDLASLSSDPWNESWAQTLLFYQRDDAARLRRKGCKQIKLWREAAIKQSRDMEHHWEDPLMITSFAKKNHWEKFCNGINLPSLRAFCPEACGCRDDGFSRPCPDACKKDYVSVTKLNYSTTD